MWLRSQEVKKYMLKNICRIMLSANLCALNEWMPISQWTKRKGCETYTENLWKRERNWSREQRQKYWKLNFIFKGMWSDYRQWRQNKHSMGAWAWTAWIISHFRLQSLAITRPTFYIGFLVNNSRVSCEDSWRDVPLSDWIRKEQKKLREIFIEKNVFYLKPFGRKPSSSEIFLLNDFLIVSILHLCSFSLLIELSS